MTNRREFIKQSGLGLLGLPLLTRGYLAGQESSGGVKARVVVARDAQVVSDRNRCDPARLAILLDRALLALTGAADVPAAWHKLGLNSQDTVAVKLNCNTWTVNLFPHPELVQALGDSLSRVIPAQRIIFYERAGSDLRDGGFSVRHDGPGFRFYGNDEGDGYSLGEELTNIVSQTASKLINLCNLKTVESGDIAASLFLKNHIGSLRDQDMPRCHNNSPFLAELNARPSIRNKTILNLCDALRGSYRRGVPWYYHGLVLGRDPIAAETVCYQIINEKRAQEGLQPLPQPQYLKIATEKYRLGSCRSQDIDRLDI